MSISIPCQDLNDLVEIISCPIALDILQDPVTLFPCTHKINKIAAESLYGSVDAHGWIKEEGSCPICRGKIYGYNRDCIFKQVVDKTNQIKTKTLSESRSKAEAQTRPPYPGELSRFKCEDTFEAHIHRIENKEYEFVASNPRALITYFKLSFLKDGKKEVQIQLSSTAHKVQEFFKHHHIKLLKKTFSSGIYKTQSTSDVSKVFSLVTSYNRLPKKIYKKIKADLFSRG